VRHAPIPIREIADRAMADLGKFVHLHVHSQYSMLDGANHLEPLVEHTKGLGMGALALTDHGNLFGAYQFQKVCDKKGVKPIFGAEVYLSPTTHTDKVSPQARTRYHFLLLCENLTGYRNLSRLVSTSFLNGFYYKPRIDVELLQQHHEGLIATSACIQGPICQAILRDQMHDAQRQLDQFVQIFGAGNFFIEIMDHGLAEQKRVNDGLLELSRKNGIPLIATNDCHYLKNSDYDAHDVLLCIQMGKTISDPDRMRFDRNEFYVKSPEQMIKDFGHLGGAIENTLAIAERCDCTIPTRQKLLPKFKTPENQPADQFMRARVQEGLRKRYGETPPPTHLERAEFELNVIETMGFVDYFLVVQDFINWAKSQDIPVGPGRGSGAGSIVAYALGITDLDPIPYGLLFERFLNPERVSMPDFDVDFCQDRRGEVIEYVKNLYGKECVSQIITFGTLKAKNAIRDVGRAMALPLPLVDQVAKLVPDGPKVKLKAALGLIDESKFDPSKEDDRKKLDDLKKQYSADLRAMYDQNSEVRELLDRALGIEGAIRQPGTHAAGVVICDQPLIDLIPLYMPTGDGAMQATQYTMGDVEEIGLLKMDFLGLKNLTLIQKALRSVNARTGQNITPQDIPLDGDKPTYDLLQRGKGLGVFQLESTGMRDLLVNFKPTKFTDLVALISLYRPGPMDNIPDFIKRKEGKEPITYEHPDMESILHETYGLFVYQEQVMQIAQVLGGYSLGGADLLRRAMSKKKKEEMLKERVKFVAGCKQRGIDEERATRVFATMEKFAEYGFNKSHAAAYAVVTVQTAWLKAHYPIDFYSALITMEIGGDDKKLAEYFDEVKSEGIRILPPDINSSGTWFTPHGNDIRFGLAGIKGVGENAVIALVEERKQGGPFKSLQDFVTRIDKRAVNSRAVDAMIKCGAFDPFGKNRPSLLEVLPKVWELAGSARETADDMQSSLFDMMSEEQTQDLNAEIPIPRVPDWPDKQRLETEKELAGFYLSGHPLERYAADFEAFSSAPAEKLAGYRKGAIVEWVGFIKRIVPRADKNGRQFAFLECEDMTGPMECTFFADAYEKNRMIIREGEVIWVKGRIDMWKDQTKILVNEALAIDAVRESRIRAVEVALPWRTVSEASLTRVLELMNQSKGRRRLWFLLRDDTNEIRLEAGNGYGIKPTSSLIKQLQDTLGIPAIHFIARQNDGGMDEDY
jgi:DNA polymerase-3 subunit alpha